MTGPADHGRFRGGFAASPPDERFRREDAGRGHMSSDNNAGLMSSAGLVRYFDAEDRNAIRFDPRSVIAFGVLFGVGIQLMNLLG